MNLFTYLMSKKGYNYLPHKDLFSYLLGKANPTPKTANGTEITINSIKGKLISLKLTKESTQDGTPSPDYPQEVRTVKGYSNSFDVSNYKEIHQSISVLNNSIILGNVAYQPIVYLFKLNVGQNYTLSFKSSTTEVYRMQVKESDSSGTSGTALLNKSITSLSYSGSFTATTEYIRIEFFQSTSTDTQTISNIMLTEGTEEHPYVPYGSNYVDVKVMGKNLFDKEKVLRNKTFTSQNVVSDSTGLFISDYIKVKPNTSYYVNENCPVVIGLDSNYNSLGYIRNVTLGGTFTTPNDCAYIRVRANNTTIAMETAIANAMVNLGTTATSYEAYKESIVPIPLNNNEIAGIGNYKDELIVDKNGHCWLNKKIGKVVLDGSETITLHVQANNMFKIANINGFVSQSSTTSSSIISNYFKDYIQNDLFNNPTYIGVAGIGGTVNAMYMQFGSTSDINNWTKGVNWITTYKPKFYYPLSTSNLIDLNTTVDLTLFNGINHISNSDDMDMTLKYY